jgi:hypothetical protein
MYVLLLFMKKTLVTDRLCRYKNMVLLPTIDNILYNIQRQGKISFYVRTVNIRFFAF